MFFEPSAEDKFRLAKYEDYFRCLDADGDGTLLWSDFVSHADALRKQMGAAADGAPGLARIQEALLGWWTRLSGQPEGHTDGRVTREDFFDLFASLDLQIRGAGGHVPPWALDQVRAFLVVLDGDGDGQVSPEEYALYLSAIGSDADATEAFTHLDLDGDGFLDVEELEHLYAEWVTSGSKGLPGNWLLTGRIPAAEG